MNIQSRETSRVGRYPANEPGLYDMSGNVYEWCQDWYASSWADANHRFDGNTIDPPGAPAGTLRVLRGGSWYDTFSCARCAHRFHAEPTLTAANWGFRCRLSVNETLLEWLGQGDRWGISNEEMRVLRESSDE
jgi:formylglycine-generating enzyme required for sulfatase activity